MSRPSRLPMSALVELCRTLRHNLGAGLSLVDVFRQQAKRGPAAVRPLADAIARDLGKGHDLEYALEEREDGGLHCPRCGRDWRRAAIEG